MHTIQLRFSPASARISALFSRGFLAFLSLVLFCALGSNTFAITTPSGMNTTDPGTGVPWNNVINVNGSGGVYLGGGWILTASHVGFDGTVTINGETLTSTDPTCQFQLTNDPNVSPNDPDLFLYRLDSTPSTDVFVPIGDLNEGDAGVTMIGWGGGKSWGTNDIEFIPGAAQNALVSGLGYSTLSVYTDYDTANPNDGQAITNDSGGGVFYQDGSGTWTLGGIIFGVSGSPMAPVDGDLTYIADLEWYSAEINSTIAAHGSVTPEPSGWIMGLFLPIVLLGASRRRRVR